MAKATSKLDTGLEDRARTVAQGLKVDPCLILFILAWNGVIYSEEIPFTTEKYSEAYQRRAKRHLQRQFGPNWKLWWEGNKAELRKRKRSDLDPPPIWATEEVAGLDREFTNVVLEFESSGDAQDRLQRIYEFLLNHQGEEKELDLI